MADKLNSLKDLFIHQLRDLYDAKTQVIELLPFAIKKTTNERLEHTLKDFQEVSERHKQRLSDAFKELDEDPAGVTCKAMYGLVKETKEIMKADADPNVIDAGLIADIQRIKHYEIAGYGAVCTYAEELGFDDIKESLGLTLSEIKKADQELAALAKSSINIAAEN